jgi:hypothetical protein
MYKTTITKAKIVSTTSTLQSVETMYKNILGINGSSVQNTSIQYESDLKKTLFYMISAQVNPKLNQRQKKNRVARSRNNFPNYLNTTPSIDNVKVQPLKCTNTPNNRSV